jgi:altronate dehydratase large subunit
MTAVEPRLAGFRRADGSVGCRNHVLVLPSVVCATRVARDIARSTGAVTIVHQHGCGQIGDDEVQTSAAFTGISCNPNVAAAVVVSLGCETIQGRQLADRIRDRGQEVEFIGIQETGGSEPTVELGRRVALRTIRSHAADERAPISPSAVVLGIEASRRSRLADAFASRALDEGVSVVFGDRDAVPADVRSDCDLVPAFAVERACGRCVALEDAGSGPEQHAALASAGAQLIVSVPADDQGPVGFPLCPVVSVAGSSPLHQALSDEFDVSESDGVEELWRVVEEVHSGVPAVAESLGHPTFALPRLARTM